MHDPQGAATERQKSYARQLGLSFSEQATKQELSDLIEGARAAKAPSDKQAEFARKLGIVFDDGVSGRELSKRINTEVTKRSQAALKSNPALEAGSVIIYKDEAYKITSIGKRSGRYTATLKPFFSRKGLRTITVMVISIESATFASNRDLERVATMVRA